MRREDLQSMLRQYVRAQHKQPISIRDEDVRTALDGDEQPLRVFDAHDQRIDRVRAAVTYDGGVYVLVLATVNGSRGLVANEQGLVPFAAFVAGGSITLVSESGDDVVGGVDHEVAADSDGF